MDQSSITMCASALASSITKVSLTVTAFTRDFPIARADLDTLSCELLYLKSILELLTDGENNSASNNVTSPKTLQNQITGILKNCNGILNEISDVLEDCRKNRSDKTAKWANSGQRDVAKLKQSLQAHKSALYISLDILSMLV